MSRIPTAAASERHPSVEAADVAAALAERDQRIAALETEIERLRGTAVRAS